MSPVLLRHLTDLQRHLLPTAPVLRGKHDPKAPRPLNLKNFI